MSKVVTIASSAVNAKLHEPTREAKLEVQRILSYRVEGAERTTAFKQGGWDGRSSFFDFKNAVFPAGFVHYVGARLRRAGYTVNLVSKPLPAPLGPENPKVDEFPEDPRYDYQMDVSRRLVKHGQIIAQVATGGGKCLGKDTPVLMFDGTIKMVQDVQTGDLLMGPDSTPRTVLSTCVGRSPLYRVTPTKGDAYVVNDAHILSLKKTSRGYRGKNRDGEKYPKGEIANINVEDYVRQNKTFKHTYKGWRTGVEFAHAASLPVDPYLLGVILGDGSINGAVSVTTADDEIRSMLEEQAAAWGLRCNAIPKAGNAASAIYLTSGRTGGKANPLMVALRDLGFASSDKKAVAKFVPHAYKTASRADRLALLAGVLDTDGYFDGKRMYLTLKEERLFDDMLFLVRSLGFAAYKSVRQKMCCNNGAVGTYFSMTISGDLDQVPVRLERRKAPARLQKKDHLVTGLSVEAIGEGDYYGFELDGDHLFMLGDFTVTHNTRIARLAFARINRPTLFLTTRSILMYQMKDSFEKDFGVQCSVLGDGQFGHTDETGQFYIKKMCVGMVQTLVSRLEVGDIVREFEKLYDSAKKKGIHFNKNEAKKIAERRAFEQNRIRAQTISLLSKFEFVILEEAHEASGNGYYEILRHCKNAHYRLALTGTPFMRDDEEANMRLMACSGPVAIKVTEKMLIDRGILAKPYFKFVPLTKKPDKLYSATAWQAAYRLGIVDNAERNQAIVNEIIRASSYGLSSMVLIQHTRHGEMLEKLLKDAGVRVEFIKGENDQAERKSALAKLSTGQTDALIGTTILDVGVDVPAVGLVVLAGGGKAEVSLRQRIGRGLRAKKTGPNVALVIDFDDRWNNHTKTHSRQRMDIIKGTEGFCENIVSGDFDMAAMGFSRKKA